LPPEEKRGAGEALNKFKTEIQRALSEIEERCQRPEVENPLTDLTLPGKKSTGESPHPTKLFFREK